MGTVIVFGDTTNGAVVHNLPGWLYPVLCITGITLGLILLMWILYSLFIHWRFQLNDIEAKVAKMGDQIGYIHDCMPEDSCDLKNHIEKADKP